MSPEEPKMTREEAWAPYGGDPMATSAAHVAAPPPQGIDLRNPETANAVADAIVRYHGGGYVPLSVRYPWQFQSRTWQAIDPDALHALVHRYTTGHLSTTEFEDAILALVCPVEGVVLTPGTDEAGVILRARDLLVREGDDFWLANTLRALAARLEAAQ